MTKGSQTGQSEPYCFFLEWLPKYSNPFVRSANFHQLIDGKGARRLLKESVLKRSVVLTGILQSISGI